MTHYDLLGIDPSATPAEIHAAYRTRARQAHLDTGHTATGDQRPPSTRPGTSSATPPADSPTTRSSAGTAPSPTVPPNPARRQHPPEADLGPDAVSGSSVRLLRRLLVTAMILAVAATAAIVLIGFLQGP